MIRTLRWFCRTFCEKVSAAGVNHFIIHARKAWLQGLTPKENREIPPLDYDLVHRMKAAFPHLTICINGGVTTLAQAQALLDHGLGRGDDGPGGLSRPGRNPDRGGCAVGR